MWQRRSWTVGRKIASRNHSPAVHARRTHLLDHLLMEMERQLRQRRRERNYLHWHKLQEIWLRLRRLKHAQSKADWAAGK